MSKPRLLDLFSGAGGAARGYQLAGFEVVGADHLPQPRYAGDHFHQADVMEVGLPALLRELGPFDAIHASPPCHDHSKVSGRNRRAAGAKGTGWILAATIRAVRVLPLPWVVENVETATWPADVYRFRLCGSSFGLDVRRHRWFASNVGMLTPPCAHWNQEPRFRSLDSRQKTPATVIGVHGHLNYAGEFELRCRAMGIDWMTNEELSQAIPPAYTAWIGAGLVRHLEASLSAALQGVLEREDQADEADALEG